MIRVDLPDHGTFVDFPDGTDPAEMERVLSQNFPTPAAADATASRNRFIEEESANSDVDKRLYKMGTNRMFTADGEQQQVMGIATPSGMRAAATAKSTVPRLVKDAPKMVALGVDNVGIEAGQALDFLGAHDSGRAIKDLYQNRQEETTNTLDPETQRIQQIPVYDDETGQWNTDVAPEKFLTGALQSAPDMAAALIPSTAILSGLTRLGSATKIASVLQKMGAGEKVAGYVGDFLTRGIAGGGVEGVQAGLGNSAQTEQKIRQAPVEKLATLPAFQEAYAATDASLPEEQRIAKARDVIANKAALEVFLKTIPSTGGLGILTGGGATGMLSEKLAGRAVAGELAKEARRGMAGFAKNAAEGFGEEALQEGLQSPAEQYIQNVAEQKYADPGTNPMSGVINSAVEGAGSGGLMGLAGGAGSHLIQAPERVAAPVLTHESYDDVADLPKPTGMAGPLSRAVNRANLPAVVNPIRVTPEGAALTPSQYNPLTTVPGMSAQDIDASRTKIAGGMAGPATRAQAPATASVQDLALDGARDWAQAQIRTGQTQYMKMTGESPQAYAERLVREYKKAASVATPGPEAAPENTLEPTPVAALPATTDATPAPLLAADSGAAQEIQPTTAVEPKPDPDVMTINSATDTDRENLVQARERASFWQKGTKYNGPSNKQDLFPWLRNWGRTTPAEVAGAIDAYLSGKKLGSLQQQLVAEAIRGERERVALEPDQPDHSADNLEMVPHAETDQLRQKAQAYADQAGGYSISHLDEQRLRDYVKFWDDHHAAAAQKEAEPVDPELLKKAGIYAKEAGNYDLTGWTNADIRSFVNSWEEYQRELERDSEGKLDAQAHEAASSPLNEHPEPPPAQIEAGNYKKGHIRLHGMDISIENPAGSIRSGVDTEGKPWETELAHHYGYIRGGAKGADKDHLDIFLTPGAETAEKAWVVDQVHPKTGAFDEHKILVGPKTKEEAKSAYLSNYDHTGTSRIGAITGTSIDAFNEWRKNGDTKKPFGMTPERPVLQQKGTEEQENVASDIEREANKPHEGYSEAVRTAMKDWRDGRAYTDGQGNYRLRAEGVRTGSAPVAPWNKEVKKTFASVKDFHEAAESNDVTADEPAKAVPKQAPSSTQTEPADLSEPSDRSGKPDKRKISDAGDELTYNRRNRVKTGLTWSDVAEMNDALKAKEVTKAKVSPKPEYEDLIANGMPALVAYMVKQVYDSIAATPQLRGNPTDDHFRLYIQAAQRVMDGVMKWAADHDAVTAWAQKQVRGHGTIIISEMAAKQEGKSLLDTVYPDGWRNHREEVHILGGNKILGALQPGVEEGMRASKAIAKGWPGKLESWQVQGLRIAGKDTFRTEKVPQYDKSTAYVIRQGDGNGRHITSFKEEGQAKQYMDDLKPWILLDKRDRVKGSYTTEEEAKEAARQGVKKGRQEGPVETGMNVDQAERTGPEWRLEGETVDAQKLQKTFGFRGVNFGNWMPDNERQLHLNHTYDSLHDLAEILNVPPKALSLDGMLGIAFGAQGNGGNAAAHFVPGVNEINLTRTSGAGSLTHEWAHALDHYFAVQAGISTSRNPFLSETPPAKDSNIRPEIVSAFRTIVDAMVNREETPQEVEQRLKASTEYAQNNLEMWLKRIGKLFEGHQEQVTPLIERIKKGDVGDGYVSIGRATTVYPVVADMRDLYKKVTGQTMPKDDLTGLHRSLFTVSYHADAEAQAKKPMSVSTQYRRDARALDADKKKPYWSTRLEMFARAFDAFVSDEIEAREAKNSYLSHTGRDSETVPRGEERKRIDDAFKSLIRELKTKETPQGAALYALKRKTVLAGDAGLGEVTVTPVKSLPFVARALASENAEQVLVKGGNVDAINRIAKGFGKTIIFYRGQAGPELRHGGPEHSAQVDGARTASDLDVHGPEDGKVRLQSGRVGKETDAGGHGARQSLPNGFMLPDRSNFIFLNVDAGSHLLYIVGHELGHALKAEDPKLWHKMAQDLSPLVQRWSEYRGLLSDPRYAALSEQAQQEELFSDVMGHHFLNDLFWRDLAQENQGLFKRLAQKAVELINKALRLIVGIDARRYISDLTQSRAIISRTLLDYAENLKKGEYAKYAGQIDDAYLEQRLTGYSILKNLREQGISDQELQKFLEYDPRFAAAWHGTPHSFDKFSADHIGTGEGAQAYGHGLYFAGNKEVAEYYKRTLSEDGFGVPTIDGIPVDELTSLSPDAAQMLILEVDDRPGKTLTGAEAKRFLLDHLEEFKDNPNYAETYPQAKARIERTAPELLEVPGRDKQGHLYQVELAPKNDEYLLWDKPLSEQSDTVKTALANEFAALEEEYKGSRNPLTMTGAEFYRGLSMDGDKAASEYLHSLGVRGIKYLDGASRSTGGYRVTWENGKKSSSTFKSYEQAEILAETYEDDYGKGTIAWEEPQDVNHNYVVFNDNDVQITAKYALRREVEEVSPVGVLKKLANFLNPLDYSRFAKFADQHLPEDAKSFLDNMLQTPFWKKETVPAAKPFYDEFADREVQRFDNNIRMFGGLLDREGKPTLLSKLKDTLQWTDKVTAWGKLREDYYEPLSAKEKAAYDVLRFEGDAFSKVYDTLANALRNPRIKAAGVNEAVFGFYQKAIKAEQDSLAIKLQIVKENMEEAGMDPEKIKGHIAEYRAKMAEMEGWVNRDHGEGDHVVQVRRVIDRLDFNMDKVQKDGEPTDRIRLAYYPGHALTKDIQKITKEFGGSFKQTGNGALIMLFKEGEGAKALEELKAIDLEKKPGEFWKVLVYSKFVNSEAGAKKLAHQVESNLPQAIPRNYRQGQTFETEWKFADKVQEYEFQALQTSDMELERVLTESLKKAKSKGEMTEEQYQEVQKAAVQATAETLLGRGAGLYQIRRANYLIEGYDTSDAIGKYQQYVNGVAGMLSKARYSLRQYKHLQNVPAKVREWAFKYVQDSLRNMGHADRISGDARAFASIWYLGMSASWMLVNSTQPYTFGQAELSRYTKGAATRIAKAEMDVIRDHLSPEERALFHNEEVLTQERESFQAEMAGQMEGVGGAWSRALHTTARVSLAIGQKVEVLNRRAVILAAYRTFREQGFSMEVSFHKAMEVNSTVNIDMGRHNLPTWARNPAGRTLYTLQSYIMHALNYLYHRSASGETKDQKAILRLLWVMFLLGGVPAGAPGSDELDQKIRDWFGYSPKLEFRGFTHRMGKQFGTLGEMLDGFIWHGIPGALNPFGIGFSLTGAIQFRLPIISNLIAGDDMMQSLGGPVYGLGQKAWSGGQQATRGDWTRAAEYLAPNALASILSGYRQTTQGVKTSHGKPVFYRGKLLKMTPVEGAIRATGFQPSRTADISETRRIEKELTSEWNSRRTAAVDDFRINGSRGGMQMFNRGLRRSQATGIVSPITSETLQRAKGGMSRKATAWERKYGLD